MKGTYKNLSLYSSKLSREVKIYVHLPRNYNNVNSYPVLYMHDGEIIFNDFENDDSQIGILEKYTNTIDKKEVILVGIGSGEGTLRIDELCPFSMMNQRLNRVIGGKTDKYFEFIIEELMPIMNEKFACKKGANNTGMLGISLGGLCTLYAATTLTSHFSRFAFVSSAHSRVFDDILEVVENSDFKDVKALYSDVGTKESLKPAIAAKFLESNKKIYEVLKEKTLLKKFKYSIIEDSKHETSYWNERFIDIVEFLYERDRQTSQRALKSDKATLHSNIKLQVDMMIKSSYKEFVL